MVASSTSTSSGRRIGPTSARPARPQVSVPRSRDTGSERRPAPLPGNPWSYGTFVVASQFWAASVPLLPLQLSKFGNGSTNGGFGRSPSTRSSPLPPLTVSSPNAPKTASLPLSPLTTSFCGPPTAKSAPLPPGVSASPLKPATESSPFPPRIVSLPPSPNRSSLPS